MSGEASARRAALAALGRIGRGPTFLRDDLHAIFDRTGLAPRDRALATQLATGTVRHRRTLRRVLSHVRGEPGGAAAIQPDLRLILELGTFQLLFLDRVPAYAAVNEAVDEAGRTVGVKAAGFVNAMLRGVGRLIVGRDPDGDPARDALPHPEGGVLRLAADVLPDPTENRIAFLGAAYSYPDWLVAKWLDLFGDRTEAVCRWGNRRPRTFARVNPMRHDAADLLRTLRAEAPEVVEKLSQDRTDRAAAFPGRREDAAKPCAGGLGRPPAGGYETVCEGPRTGSLDVSALSADRLETLIRDGDLTVQDPSAMAAVEALAPLAGETVLDLCASPGTKTTQIVEAMGDGGVVVAADRNVEKLRPLRRTVAARGLESVTVCLAAEMSAAAPVAGFDAALVDVPCSNTGVLARRVEARWRLKPKDVPELVCLQTDLLDTAAARVGAGGRLVYSTCSLLRDENEGVVEAFLNSHRDWALDRQDLILPGPNHDSAFWALLRRT